MPIGHDPGVPQAFRIEEARVPGRQDRLKGGVDGSRRFLLKTRGPRGRKGRIFEKSCPLLVFWAVTVQSKVIENTNTFGFAAISMGSYKNHRIEGNTIRQGTWYAFSGPNQETEKENGSAKGSPAPDLPPPCDPDCYPEDGGRFDVAIAVGRPVWSRCNDTFSDAAGTVIRNNVLVQRSAMYRYGGYGIAIARVANIVVTGNTAMYTPSGRGAGCSGRPLPDNASAFQFMECSNCTLQPEFQPAVSLWNLLMRR